MVYNTVTGETTEYEINVPWQQGIAYVREKKLYYLAGMKIKPQVRDVFFKAPKWLSRKMYVLDLERLVP